MEKSFKFLKSAPIQNNSNDYFEFKDDILKMMDLGLVIKDSGWFKLNPLIKSKKSVSEARKSLKSKVESWLNEMERLENIQLQFREDMVEYFKNNPIVNNTMPIDVPWEYKNGKGYCYILNNNIVSLHAGYKPPKNTPQGCDRFKYEAINGMIQIV